MAAEEGFGVTIGQENGMANANGVALLVAIAEPFGDEQRELILERLTKSFRGFESSIEGFDLNTELQAVATAAPPGEEGPDGEVVVQHSTGSLAVFILVNPQIQTFTSQLRQFLLLPCQHRIVVYSGQVIQGCGSWILQDDILTFANFETVFKEANVQNALKQSGGVLDLHFIDEGDWSPVHIAKRNLCKDLQVNINPAEVIQDFSGILQFTAYLSYFVKVKSCKQLLQSSDVVGNIRFTRPTLYVFPGCQGDSALFGISGFNLLVNAGYSRKACFWGFTRHLDRIDALLLTHLGADNLFSIGSVFERKAIENVHPEIGHIYYNAVEKTKHSPNGDIQPENGGSHKPVSLVVSLAEQANRLVENMKFTGQVPHPCVGHIQGSVLQPMNLYHKVGHGTLDMYVLNPTQDSKELKDFLVQWNKGCHHFTSTKNGIPLPNQTSVCALLVWKPASPNENITRILFPGNTPQTKIFEGLDRLKTLDIFKQATCSQSSLHPSKASKKPAGGGVKSTKTVNNAGTSPIPRASPVLSAKTEPKKAPTSADRKPPAKPASAGKPSSAASKPAKEAKNKKATAGSKDDKEKKSPSTTSSASKGESPGSDSVEKLATPSNTPVEADIQKTEVEKVAAEAAASLAQELKPTEQAAEEPSATTPAAEPQMERQEPVVEAAQSEVSPEEVQPEMKETSNETAAGAEPATGNLVDFLAPADDKKVPDAEPSKEEPVADQLNVPSDADPGTAKQLAEPEQQEVLLSAAGVASPAAEQPTDTADNSEASQISTETDTATVQSVEGMMESPEALPHPQQFDAATFEAVAMKSNIADDKPEEPRVMEPESSLPEAEQQQNVSETPAEAPEPEKDTAKLDVQADRLSISSEEEKELPTPEELRDETGLLHQQDGAEEKVLEDKQEKMNKAEKPNPAGCTESTDLTAFGIYENEAVIKQCLESADSKTLAELGLVEGVDERPTVDVLEPTAAEKQEAEEATELDDDSLADATDPSSTVADDRHADSLEHLAGTAVEEPKHVGDSVGPSPTEKASDNQMQMNQFVGMQLNTTTEQNPFDIPDVPVADQQNVPDLLQPHSDQQERDSLEREPAEGSFDPLKEWGQPMGLPAPDGGATKKESNKKAADGQKKTSPTKTGGKGGPTATAATTAKRPTDGKKLASATDGKRPEGTTSPRKPASATGTRTTKKPEAKSADDAVTAAKKAPVRDAASKRATVGGSTTAKKAAASAADKPASPKPDRRSAMARSAGPGARKTGASAVGGKGPSVQAKLSPVTPFFVDLSYIPGHGDVQYVDMNFFRRIRARYYVLSGLNPSTSLLNCLLEAKQTWDDPNFEVTVIPTYDTDSLRHWMGLNRDQLSQLKIDFAPSASRCTIQLQDHEASCAAYRLEF